MILILYALYAAYYMLHINLESRLRSMQDCPVPRHRNHHHHYRGYLLKLSNEHRNPHSFLYREWLIFCVTIYYPSFYKLEKNKEKKRFQKRIKTGRKRKSNWTVKKNDQPVSIGRGSTDIPGIIRRSANPERKHLLDPTQPQGSTDQNRPDPTLHSDEAQIYM